MRRWLAVAVAVVALALAGCGSADDEAERDAARPTADVADQSDDGPDLAELIADLANVGCELAEVDPTEGYDIHRQAACADGSLVIYTFVTASARDEVVEGIAGIEGEFAVVGDDWVAETKTRAMADNVKAAIGGTVRPSSP